MARTKKSSNVGYSQEDLLFIAQWCAKELLKDAVKDLNNLHNILEPTRPWLSTWKRSKTDTVDYVPTGEVKGRGGEDHYIDLPTDHSLTLQRTVKASGLSLKVGRLELGYIKKTVHATLPEVKEVQKYEPKQYSVLTLVRTKVFEKVGRLWRKRKFWRLAGTDFRGRVDHIRCDGPNLPLKETLVPANYRRGIRLEIARKERSNDLVGQQKRYRIASVPMAIRFARAVQLKYRLDEQASREFERGNLARYDSLDRRAASVTKWLHHIATLQPDLSYKRPVTKEVNASAKMKAAEKNALLTGRHASRSDMIASRKLREARINRAETFKRGRTAWK